MQTTVLKVDSGHTLLTERRVPNFRLQSETLELALNFTVTRIAVHCRFQQASLLRILLSFSWRMLRDLSLETNLKAFS